MSTMRSQDEIRNTVVSLGLPEHPYFMRRTARAMDLLDTGKVNFVGDDIFRVHSQFDETIYHVELNHGTPGCTCADHQKNPGVLCKHMIAATIYSKQAQPAERARTTGLYKALTIYDDTANSYLGRGRWVVTDHVARIRYQIYRDKYGGLHCPCEKGRKRKDCEHKKAIREYLNTNGDGNGSKITNECGSEHAKQLQDKLNGQLNKSGNNGNGANKAPSQYNIDPSAKIFVECDNLDEQQILAGEGDKVHKLSDGSYAVAYFGIMSLSDKYGIITESLQNTPKQGFVTVKAFRPDTKNQRQSCQPVNGSLTVAIEKARRNAIRPLIPMIDIRCLEKKYQLESEFSWEVAYQKCQELVGGKAQVDIIIYHLVKDEKIRQQHPSNYDRTEWLIIHDACKQDASNDNNDGGEISPSSPPENGNPNWREWYNKCVAASSLYDAGIVINQMTPKHYYRKDRITDDEWQRIFEECKRRREEYERTQAAKAEFASAQKKYEHDYIRWKTGYDVKSKKYVGRPPLNSKEFLAKCQEAIEKVRAEKNTVEANEQPLESGNVKRQLQMDKKLRTWLIEADGTKKKISCREICEQFESKQNPSIVKRLREGIDDGADISTVELD